MTKLNSTTQTEIGTVFFQYIKKDLQEILDIGKDLESKDLHASGYLGGQVALAQRLMQYVKTTEQFMKEQSS